MEQADNIERLFKEVKALSTEFEKVESFNAFEAINFLKQEVMHSHFIATLLNPNGKHKIGDAFLKIFLDEVGISEPDTSSAKIRTESSAGKRRIDIKIELANTIIAIENKIWANDEKRQLADYYENCNSYSESVKMIYLTMEGRQPSSFSLDNLDMEKVICISYKKTILNWIHRCTQIPKLQYRLKSTLEMYGEIISQLNNKTKYMDAIFQNIKSDESLEKLRTAIDIRKSLTGINYLVEFPYIIDFLQEVIRHNDSCPEPYIDIDKLNGYKMIRFDGDDFEDWYIGINDSSLNIFNGEKEINRDIIDTRNIDDPRLQSLILRDEEITEQWVNELLEEMLS
jgi:hypothetical protein